jgi:DNA repair protein RecN (Recombination protein N)
MLKKLFIQNYALIDEMEIDFGKGMNIITGETGAGKSILLGALSLILGERADKSALLDTTKKCIIEGAFETDKKHVKSFFKSNELDLEDMTIIRREISAEGKSRSFINDTPVSLAQLKELGELFVDIHSQHETLLLNNAKFQLSVVDAYAQHDVLLTDYKVRFNSYLSLLKELAGLKEEEKKSKADFDYYRFLHAELEEANLILGEQEKLEEELRTLTHAEEIKSALTSAVNGMSGGEDAIHNRLSTLSSSIHSISKYSGKAAEIEKRLRSLIIELNDIQSEIESINNEVSYEPGRIEEVNDRLNVIYRLEQKHRTKDVAELLKLKDEFENKLQNISSIEDKIVSMESEALSIKGELMKASSKISSNRYKAIPQLTTEIKKLLGEVSMPDAVLKIQNDVRAEDDFNADGIDEITFLFSANKGVAYQPINKVASGGELSRLMLCIKASVAKLISLPTIIFDEIDTGVSGEIAISVAKVLKGLSKHHQLIAITHLPQIAGRGDAHYFIYKEITASRTATKVRRLSNDERIVEIAKMLSGERPSAVALENAKELLKN